MHIFFVSASHIEVAASSISMYQREYQRPGGSPTECLLRDWSHSNATVLQLLTHLQRMSNVAGIKLLRDCGKFFKVIREGGKFHVYRDGWMDERCLRPLFCTIKAELGRGQPGLMR